MSSANRSSNSSCRIHLEQYLEALLGFDDVSDLLDHLVLLSRNDAKSYLSDLTGMTQANNNNLESFLDRMQDYRSGVRTVPPMYSTAYTSNSSSSNQGNIKPAAPTGSDNTNTSSVQGIQQTKPEQPRKKDAKMSQSTTSTIPRNPVPQTKIYGGPEKEKNQKKEPKKSFVGTATTTTTTSLLKINPDSLSSNNQGTKLIPRNLNSRSGGAGSSRKECGCYGTIHECLTNCLDCGRIACVEEGYGECFFCRKLVLDEEEEDRKNNTMRDMAIEKEQWLQRDKEFAKRTVVLDDDQVVDSYTWVVDNTERLQLQTKEEQRRKDMHTAKKDIKMNIKF